jgi:hypothetical protein
MCFLFGAVDSEDFAYITCFTIFTTVLYYTQMCFRWAQMTLKISAISPMPAGSRSLLKLYYYALLLYFTTILYYYTLLLYLKTSVISPMPLASRSAFAWFLLFSFSFGLLFFYFCFRTILYLSWRTIFPPPRFFCTTLCWIYFLLYFHIYTQNLFSYIDTLYIYTHTQAFTLLVLNWFFFSLYIYIYTHTHTHRILCLSFGVSVREPGGKKNLI